MGEQNEPPQNQVSPHDLLMMIGQLTVENQLLRTHLQALQGQMQAKEEDARASE